MAEKRLEEIRQGRLQKRQQLIDAGDPPYPVEVRRTHTIAEILGNFAELAEDGTAVMVLGRVMNIRRHGGLVFLDVHDESGGVQLQATKDSLAQEQFERLGALDTGDWVQAAGTLTKTERGLETVTLTELTIVSKAIRPLPDSWYGLKDHEARFRQREVDLLLNQEAQDVFRVRARIIAWLRDYLAKEGYVEVETPVLQPIAGGATAKPFVTHHNTLDIDLYLRVASELYLKRLLVAGYEKVFEIGTRFRNEGIDQEHNPEFTMLESQWAYADYEDLMDFTETILEQLVREIAGAATVTWQDHTLSFAKPFDRLRYVDAVSQRVGVDILEEKDPKTYRDIFAKEGLELPVAQTYTQMVDELYKKLIRPTLIQPTLVYDYPAEMVPLAKQSVPDPRIAEKFQLLVGGMELNNCYTELNDPVLQRERLQEQQDAREAGDDEAHSIDEDYLRAMEYGMPPNAGWSLGIDRMVMVLTNRASIRDVILFPLLKPKQDA